MATRSFAGASPSGMIRKERQLGNFQSPLSGRIAGPMTALPAGALAHAGRDHGIGCFAARRGRAFRTGAASFRAGATPSRPSHRSPAGGTAAWDRREHLQATGDALADLWAG